MAVQVNKSLLKQTGSPKPSAENELMDCIRQEAVVFDLAVKLLERLELAAEKRELGTPENVNELQLVLEKVVGAQQHVAESRSRFDAAGVRGSAELQSVIRRHEDTLHDLVNRINQMKNTFEEVQAALGQRVDTGTRHRNMQVAYSKSLKTI